MHSAYNFLQITQKYRCTFLKVGTAVLPNYVAHGYINVAY